MCGTQNEISHKRCIKCDSYLLEGVNSAKIKIDKKSIERFKKLKKARDVICPTCGTTNKGYAKHCINCGAWLLDEYWKARPIQKGQRQIYVKGSSNVGWFWWLSIAFLVVCILTGVLKSITYGSMVVLLISAAALVVGIIHPKSVIKWATPSRGNVLKSMLPIIIVSFLIIGVTNDSAETDKVPTTTPINNIETEEQYKASCSALDYDTLARATENYIGKRVVLTGQVAEVKDGAYGYIRVYATKGAYEMWDDAIWVNYIRPDDELRVLEGDVIQIWGTVKGRKTYRAVLGNKIELPEIDGKYIAIVQKKS